MKSLKVLVLGLSVALAATIACSSSSSSGNGGGINCSGSIGGQTVCYSYTDVPDSLTAADLCVGGLSSVSTCPTANLTGCCEKIPEGAGADTYTVGYCYYSLPSSDVSTLQTECTGTLKGTWMTK